MEYIDRQATQGDGKGCIEDEEVFEQVSFWWW